MFEGLQLVNRLGFKYIIIETDSQQVVKDIQSNTPSSIMDRNLISKIKALNCQDKKIILRHIYHEANMCADALSKHGILHLKTMCVFEACYTFVNHLLDNDLF